MTGWNLPRILISAAALSGIGALSACDRPEPSQAPAGTGAAVPTGEGTAKGTAEVEPTGTIIIIEMLTRDPANPGREHVFAPNLVTASVGDTIRFVPTEPSHQSSSIATMLPAGAGGWEGAVNEEVSYVLPRPGIYGYQCVSHYAAGMVGLIIVEGEGQTDNLAAAVATAHPGRAAPQFYQLFEQARERGLLD